MLSTALTTYYDELDMDECQVRVQWKVLYQPLECFLVGDLDLLTELQGKPWLFGVMWHRSD